MKVGLYKKGSIKNWLVLKTTDMWGDALRRLIGPGKIRNTKLVSMNYIEGVS